MQDIHVNDNKSTYSTHETRFCITQSDPAFTHGSIGGDLFGLHSGIIKENK